MDKYDRFFFFLFEFSKIYLMVEAKVVTLWM